MRERDGESQVTASLIRGPLVHVCDEYRFIENPKRRKQMKRDSFQGKQ